MNWVGGIKKRILLQEEEKRRQDQFFATQAAAAKLKRTSTSSRRSFIKPGYAQKKNEVMVCKRFPAADNSKSNQENDATGSTSRKSVYINRNLKLSSIHTPFSEWMMRMHYEGIKRKMKRQKSEEKKACKYSFYETVTDGSTSQVTRKRVTYSELMQSGLRSNSLNKTMDSSRRSDITVPLSQSISSTRKPNLLEGAPNVRRVSLSPSNVGKRWSSVPPVAESSKSNGNLFNHRKIKSVSVTRGNTTLKRNFDVNTTLEKKIIAKLLGGSEDRLPNDKQFTKMANDPTHLATVKSHCGTMHKLTENTRCYTKSNHRKFSDVMEQKTTIISTDPTCLQICERRAKVTNVSVTNCVSTNYSIIPRSLKTSKDFASNDFCPSYKNVVNSSHKNVVNNSHKNVVNSSHKNVVAECSTKDATTVVLEKTKINLTLVKPERKDRESSLKCATTSQSSELTPCLKKDHTPCIDIFSSPWFVPLTDDSRITDESSGTPSDGLSTKVLCDNGIGTNYSDINSTTFRNQKCSSSASLKQCHQRKIDDAANLDSDEDSTKLQNSDKSSSELEEDRNGSYNNRHDVKKYTSTPSLRRLKSIGDALEISHENIEDQETDGNENGLLNKSLAWEITKEMLHSFNSESDNNNDVSPD